MIIRYQESWDADIRRYVYTMLGLVVVFVLLLAGYRGWYQAASAAQTKRAHAFHLASALHYARAKKKLHVVEQDIQLHETLARLRANALNEAFHDKRHLRWPLTVAMEEITQGLNLQRRYDDERFQMLSARLVGLAAYFKEAEHAFLMHHNQRQITQVNLSRLLTTLDQLSALHRHRHEEILFELGNIDQRFAHSFYFLLCVIVLMSIVTTRRGILAIAAIIDRHRKAEAKIQHQAFYDTLTDLPNRLLSLERLSYLISEASRNEQFVALLYIDLDDFKKVNDTMGHLVGDELLTHVADRLRESVRASDTVGRLGGDEFVVMLGGLTDLESVSLIAETLVLRTSQPYNIRGKELVVTASVGIAMYPDDGETAEDLLKKSDSAMYHSKRRGRNMHSYFTEEMHLEVLRRLNVEQELCGAIQRNEIEVYYQPQYDLSTNRIMGAEALLRWRHVSLGVISPSEFIPIAEQSGTIIALGKFVLSHALNMTHYWQAHFLPDFRISVNLSPRQFRDASLVQQIQQVLHNNQISGEHLELEITEGVLLSASQEVEQVLAALSALKISLAMDDFGTGYSSLSYLRQYPFDVVKIDQSFVRDIVVDPRDRELINAALGMAHSLKLRVIAEGVESEEQLAQLKALGCDYAQGYFFSGAISADQMTQLLSEQAAQVCAAS